MVVGLLQVRRAGLGLAGRHVPNKVARKVVVRVKLIHPEGVRPYIFETERGVWRDFLLVSQIPHFRPGRGLMWVQVRDEPAPLRDALDVVAGEVQRMLTVYTGEHAGYGTQQVVGESIGTLGAVVRIVGAKTRHGHGELIISVPEPQGVRIGEHPVAAAQNAVMLALRQAISKAEPRVEVVIVGINEVLGQASLGRSLVLDP